MRKVLGVLLVSAVLTGMSANAWADPKDYAFVPVNDHLPPSATAPVQVRLMHLPTKKPVTDAIIIQSRLEMPMPGMAPMPGKVTAQAPDGKGIYPFVADLSMGGQWTLNLAAKVQGEPGTITGQVPLLVGAAPATAMGGMHNH